MVFGFNASWEELREKAIASGLCVPRRPSHGGQVDAHCEKSGRRIRISDGHCQDCVKWGA